MTCMDRRRFLRSAGVLAATACSGNVLRPLMASETAPSLSAAEKLGWRLGCCAYSFNHLTFFETVDKVASLGLKNLVGFNWQKLSPQKPDAVFSENMSAADRAETKKRLADAGVKIPCCYCGGLAEEGPTRKLFDFAREMGIETIDGEPPIESLGMLEELCEEYHIQVAIHSHAKPAPHWQPDDLMKMFEGRSRWIGACCDTGHWARSGLNPIETLQKIQKRILTFDLKDVNKDGVCVPFGTGKGDISGILKELHRQQFKGVFGIEFDSQQPANVEKNVAQCIAYFNKTAKELVAMK